MLFILVPLQVLIFAVRFDDFLYQPVPYHIFGGQFHFCYAVDMGEQVNGLGQAGFLVPGQINLG
jgi:hypothetical protein